MDNQWKRQLRREASAHHMCEDNRLALNSIETKSEAIALYKKTIDWALEEGYPDIDTIRRDFSDCQADGIFVDRKFIGELFINQQVYVFHNCSGKIRVGLNVHKRIIPMLYFANGCNITVSGYGGGDVKVPLYVFGPNLVYAKPTEGVSFQTYKFDLK